MAEGHGAGVCTGGRFFAAFKVASEYMPLLSQVCLPMEDFVEAHTLGIFQHALELRPLVRPSPAGLLGARHD